MGIRHSHIPHNVPYLRPNILHNLRFSFLLGITAVPREIENNTYAKCWGGVGGGGIRCIMGVSKWRIHVCRLPRCDKVLGRIGCTCNTADINCYVVFSWDQEYISVAKGAAYPRYRRMWQRKHICIEGILEPEAFFFCPFTIKSCKLQQSKLHFGNIEKQTVPFTRCYWRGLI